MRFREWLAVAVLGGVAATSHAVPVTFDFEGVITFWGENGDIDTTKNGETFSGTYTIDLANVIDPAAGGGSVASVGCLVKVLTACSTTPGDVFPPVVTFWRFVVAGRSFAFDPGFDGSVVSRATKNETTQEVRVDSSQILSDVTPQLGEVGTAFSETFSLLVNATGLNPGGADATTAPQVSTPGLLSPGGFFYEREAQVCAFAGSGGCNLSSGPAIFVLGDLTSWTVRDAPVAVPEPASLLLVGVGLAGLAAMRRLRR